ncbi:MAG TPA: phenylalanine--tRNA ligase subunit beta [Gammaproteobacteria bacterium]|nr:phenylalanine--tRNA ligase subunit beta [Gammaproteobacteria bacterium]
MHISENWLREWSNPALNTEELCERLTLAGLEIGTVEPAAPPLEQVVVGEILSTASHPNADRLKLCKVDIGQPEPLDIVCGAPNARDKLKVAVALVGARLPGDLKIKKSKIRGEVSFGMLCSGKELELDLDGAGIIELPEDAPPGIALDEYLRLADHILEVELTPNRGDCLSAMGLARDLAAITNTHLQPPTQSSVPATLSDRPQIEISAPDACPRYAGRILRNVNSDAPTPIWMQEKLRRSGIRSLGLIIDITNFVMLELGQPMHAFDLDKLSGGITVRMANAGESITLLNGDEKQLDSDTLLIADQSGPIAAAGIMGGAESAVSEQTRNLLLESAWFAPAAIAGRARDMGLHTDASHRFERGVDPAIQQLAIERATELILELAGGECGPVVEQCIDAHLPSPAKVLFQPATIGKRLGMEISEKQIGDILRRLGIDLEQQGIDWVATPPSWRFDIAIAADLVEEIARVVGYDAIPAQMPPLTALMSPVSDTQQDSDRLVDALVDRGYQEAITYSFVDPQLQQLFNPEQTATVELINPLSSELSQMRRSLWPGLVNALQFNLHRQQNRIKLFEIGQVFNPFDKEVLQPTVISSIITGPLRPESWAEEQKSVDFFDLKGDVEYLLQSTGSAADFAIEAGRHAALHPGRSAQIKQGEDSVGWLGELHPNIAAELGISGRVYLSELMIEPLLQRALPAYQTVSRFPSLRRDLALLVDMSVTAASLEQSVRKAAGQDLQEFRVFDVYQGTAIAPNKKSIAVGMSIGNSTRTLTDDEVEALVQRVLEALERDHGARLRD